MGEGRWGANAKRERARAVAYLRETASKITDSLRDDDLPDFRLTATIRADALNAAARAIERERHLRGSR